MNFLFTSHAKRISRPIYNIFKRTLLFKKSMTENSNTDKDTLIKNSSMSFKIYTKTGDKGQTSLLGGTRVNKDNEIFDLLGDIDELNSYLGLCCYYIKDKNKEVYDMLYEIQNILVGVSSYIASKENEKYLLKQTNFEEILEKEIDRMDSELPPLKNFIHPGGTLEASHLHFARTIARRVERKYVNFYADKEEKRYLKIFNRLSDYLFVLARYMNHIQNVEDVIIKN